jgi:beta-lactamase regulating signal transducer with metallopeptidase domain/thiol-disulfide isomerase/thioredoxin
LMLAYFAGCLACALGVAIAALRVRLLLKQASPVVSGPWPERLVALAHRLGVRRHVRLFVTAQHISPLATGIVRPTIVLPQAALAGLSCDDVETILAHELAHHRRGDLYVNWLQALLGVVWWFNPALWLLNRVMNSTREECCDDLILSSRVVTSDSYCETLLRAAASLSPRVPGGTAIGFTRHLHPLAKRIGRIMDGTLRRPRHLSFSWLIVLLLVGSVALPGVSARAVDEESTAPTPATTTLEKPAKANEKSAVSPDSPAAPPAAPLEEPTTFEIRTVDQVAEQPIEGATLTIQFNSRTTAGVTGADGAYAAALPKAPIDSAYVSIHKRGYVPVSAGWKKLPGGDPVTLPASYTFKLEPGTSIGGIVVNERQEPVAGAKVFVSLPGTNGGQGKEMSGPGAVISDYQVKTDEHGRWRCDILPAELAEVWLRVEHKDYINYTSRGGERLPMPPLRDQNAVTTLRQGRAIEGRVLDPDGQPIAGAIVARGAERFRVSYVETRSDADGRFHIRMSEDELFLTIMAAGLAPEMQQFDLRKTSEPIEIRLNKGTPLRGRIVDAQGKGIAGARVHATSWRGHNTIRWTSATDSEGRFTWPNAPADEVIMGFSDRGRLPVTATLKASAEVHEIVLGQQAWQLTGKVVDAESGKPIERFVAIRGKAMSDEMRWFREERTIDGRKGRFQMTGDGFHRYFAARVEAEGYRPEISPTYKAEQGPVEWVAKLTRQAGAAGVVHSPDGQPAVGAEVVLLLKSHFSVSINDQGGRLKLDGNLPRVTATADGRFVLPPETEAFDVLAVHKSGIAKITDTELAASGTIVLERWMRLSGAVQGPGAAKAGQAVQLRCQSDHTWWTFSSTAWTDAAGHFAFERVPAGPATISLPTPGVNGFGASPGVTNFRQGFRVAQDEDLEIKVGGPSRTVIGQFVLPHGRPWSEMHTFLQHQMTVDAAGVGPLPHPDNWDAMTAVERNGWYTTWEKSPPGLEHLERRRLSGRHLALDVRSDGTFRWDDVPVGSAQFFTNIDRRILLDERAEFARRIRPTSHSHHFEVPALDRGQPDEVLDLGKIELPFESLVNLAIGQATPEFAVTTLAGEPLRSKDLRGKFVLLDFWATWCGPCLKELPLVKEAYEEFANDPQVVFVSLSLDKTREEPLEFVAREKLAWTQGYLGEWDKANMPNEYGVLGIPAVFLIGPDGKLLAKDLRGAQIKEAIKAATAKSPAD